MSQLDEMIAGLSNGIGTFIDDRGTSINGGQKQLIRIARALFTNSKQLIFNEETSALDAESRGSIYPKGKAKIILIAYRLYTVRNTYYIIYMDFGQILDQAKYENLREQLKVFDYQAKLMAL